MGFYGYDPSSYVRPDKYGIAAAGQIAANTIGQVAGIASQQKEQERLRNEAIKKATEDAGAMDDAYKAIKTLLTKKAQPLYERKMITQQEVDEILNRLPAPTSIDKKDPGAYIDKMRTIFSNEVKLFDDKLRRANVSQVLYGQQGQQPAPQAQPSGQLGSTPTTPAVPQGDVPFQQRLSDMNKPETEYPGAPIPAQSQVAPPEPQIQAPAQQMATPSEQVETSKEDAIEKLRKSGIDYTEQDIAGYRGRTDIEKEKLEKEKLGLEKKKIESEKQKQDDFKQQMLDFKNKELDVKKATEREKIDIQSKLKRAELDIKQGMINSQMLPVLQKAEQGYTEALEGIQQEMTTENQKKPKLKDYNKLILLTQRYASVLKMIEKIRNSPAYNAIESYGAGANINSGSSSGGFSPSTQNKQELYTEYANLAVQELANRQSGGAKNPDFESYSDEQLQTIITAGGL